MPSKQIEFNKDGLTSTEASELFQKHGPNKLPEAPPPSSLAIFLSQFKSPLVYILLVAAVITFALQNYEDTLIIALALLINTFLGYVQEKRAGNTLQALKQLVQPTTRVIRDGKEQVLTIESLVPGDLVVLNQGDKIPADGMFVNVNRVFASEAVLTGESVPVAKALADPGYMGTVISSGKALMIVDKTGGNTEVGKIALSIQKADQDQATPLRIQLSKFSKSLSIVIFVLTLFVFIFGAILGKNIVEIFSTSVALAVSAIPEGLLVSLTVVLAIGMQRIMKRKGLVRNLASAETLGGVTTICTDKTGTLTEGIMQVVDVFGDKELLALQVLLANDHNDPLEIAAETWGETILKDVKKLEKQYPKLDSIPFTSEDRVLLSLNKFDNDHNVIFVNGAPEILIERSSLTEVEKEEMFQKIERLSAEGKRLIGYAQKLVPVDTKEVSITHIKNELRWIGLIAYNDPVRKDVSDALKRARAAGINLIIITGDYAQTALAVAGELGIKVAPDAILLGEAVEKMSITGLRDWLSATPAVKLLARTKPEQKLKVVEALQANGEIIAMMGDGVNDAPALAKADIGIVVDNATDVAKESADLILLDSSFATIIAAIEEGRGIFDNIRKVILYLLGDSFEEIVAILLALITFSPLPILASQILWINIVSDGFPNLALTIDPKAKDIMSRRPRNPKELILTSWMKYVILIASITGGVTAFVVFIYILRVSGNEDLARSVSFAIMGFDSLLYAFSVKTLQAPVWKENVFNNKWLNLSVFCGLVLLVVPFMHESVGRFFHVVPIGNYWITVVASGVFILATIETAKWYYRAMSKK